MRRLHTQNLTLGLDSESELDITEGETIEVDASCLERRVSSASDTPARKMKKNTSSSVMTELAAEDEVFCVPEGEWHLQMSYMVKNMFVLYWSALNFRSNRMSESFQD